MKKVSFPICLTTAFLAFIFLIGGCKKESSDTLSPEEEEQAAYFTTDSETTSQATFNDILDNVLGVNHELGTGGGGVFGRIAETGRTERVDSLPPCVKVTITPQQANVFPKTVVIDFGAGCFSHGHLRSGKITTVYSGRLIEPGRSATTTFENYKLDSIAIEGTHKVSNTTAQGANQRQFKIEVTNAKLTRPNSDYEEWNAIRVQTQIEGNGTVPPSDDIFRITGNSNGKTKRKNLLVSWTSEIQEPLIKRFNCRWFSKGIVRTGRNGLPANTPWVSILHYGDGTCDNKALLTINGNIHQITLR